VTFLTLKIVSFLWQQILELWRNDAEQSGTVSATSQTQDLHVTWYCVLLGSEKVTVGIPEIALRLKFRIQLTCETASHPKKKT